MTSVANLTRIEVDKLLNMEQCSPVLISPPSTSIIYHKRASSVPLIELKHSEDEDSSSDSEHSPEYDSFATFSSESESTSLPSKGGMCSVTDTMESLRGIRGVSPMAPPGIRIKHITRNSNGTTRFPKLDECAHFHYENVELGPVKMGLCEEKQDYGKLTGAEKENEGVCRWFCVQVVSNGRLWTVRRSYENFRMLDRQLHRCVYDRKYSLLPELPPVEQLQEDTEEYHRRTLTSYLDRFSDLAGSLISCGPVLNWLELDNRGNRLIVPDESAINTPAVAAAYVVRRYTAQATDEISFEVGDMISVIDMPPPEESTWWRGKKGFEVGFFPCECVEVIGDKIPHTLKVPKSPTKPVLRKHGKLIAFFRSFLLTRPSRRKLKQSGILKERVFGCDLGEHLLNTGREIPLVLKCCAEFIEEHGIVDGIYRLSGVNSNIQKLRLAFDEDRVPDLTDEAIVQDIHCVASLLKMYFRELPNPLLTYQLYDKFVNAVQSEEEVRLLRLRDIVQQLPPPHYRTLEYLMLHLAKVAGHGGRTGMTPKNVAIVWAPNLLRSKDVEGGGVGALHVVGVQAVLTEYLIRYADLLFNEKLPAFQSIGLDESSPRRARPKSLAISTPTKLLSLEEARSRALSANLPPAQQKYIDVGGGPDNLPPKYHTVIDFPGGKRGSGKIKKSPSGWKSFFSRGWHSGSAREKERVRTQRKVSSGSLQHTSLTMQDVAVTELDISHSKKLRTVKSAESLVLLGGGGSSSRNSGTSEFSTCGPNKPPCHQASMDYAESDDESQESSCLPLTPQHMKHNRSSSHESYFEQEMDIPLEGNEMEEDNSIFDLVSETMSRMKEQSTDKVHSLEMNSGYFAYQTLCTSESDTLPLSDVSDSGQDDLSHIPSDSSSGTQKSIRKQKLKDGESDVASAKVQKLSMMRFQQPTGSSLEKSAKDLVSSSDDDSSSTETYKWKDPESIADCSNDSTPSQNLSPPALLDGTLCFLDSKDVIISFDSDGHEKEISSETVVETLQDESEDSRVVVERYGNEETVIVEVHATQESSDEETEKSYFEASSNLEKEDCSRSQMNDISIDSNKIQGNIICSRPKVKEKADLKDIEILFVDEHGKTVEDIVDINRNVGLINKNCNTSIDGEITSSLAKETDYKSEQNNLSSNKKNMPSSSKKDDLLEVGKENESPTNIPSLRPGSFASEVMEEYLLIKKSLDQAHFQESDGQNENSNDVFSHGCKFDNSEEANAVLTVVNEVEESSTNTSVSLDKHHNSTNKDISNANVREEWTEKLINIAVEEVKKETTKEIKSCESEVCSVLTMGPNVCSKDVEKNLSEEHHQTFDGVQLRHTSSKTSNNCLGEKKRNSEPEHPLISSKHISNPTERKRMSEPASSLSGEKNTVKGLMLKFEPVVSRENEVYSDKRPSTSLKPKISHPSLFTQLKVLKLQSLQSGSSVTTPTETVDPWSDPILDLEEEKELQSPTLNERPSLVIHRDTAKISEEHNSTFADESGIEISKDNIAHETESSDVKEDKCALELSIVSSELMDISNSKGSEENSELENTVPVSCPVENSSASSTFLAPQEDEIIRRERINRIKEERRAQLREKLRSESFRMEAEEKEKVLNEFRLRKHSSGTKAATTEPSGERVKNIIPRSQREKTNESECTQRQCSRLKKESAHDKTPLNSGSPKFRSNLSSQKELPQKNFSERERYSHKQQPVKQCLHRSVSDNAHSAQEKSQSKIENPTKSCERIPCKSPVKERLKKAASLDSAKQSSSPCEIGQLSTSSKVGKRTGEKHEKVPLSPNKSQTSNQDSKRVFSPSQRAANISQKRIRERAAMFEHPRDAQEACRTGTPSNRFARQRSSPSLTPSYVR